MVLVGMVRLDVICCGCIVYVKMVFIVVSYGDSSIVVCSCNCIGLFVKILFYIFW